MERFALSRANHTFRVARGMIRTICIGHPSSIRYLPKANFSQRPILPQKIDTIPGGRIPFQVIHNEKRHPQANPGIHPSTTHHPGRNDIPTKNSRSTIKETPKKTPQSDSPPTKYQHPMELRPQDFLTHPTNFPAIYASRDFSEAWSRFYSLSKEKRLEPNPRHESPSKLDADLIDLATATQKAEIHALVTVLPKRVSEHVHSLLHADLSGQIIELYLHIGQKPRLFLRSSASTDLSAPVTRSDIDAIAANLRQITPRQPNALFGHDLRAGVPGTLHRIGVFLDKHQERILGYTIRFGRYIPFAGALIADLLLRGSVIVIAPPCCGKTTILRDSIARLCNSAEPPKVVVVDTSNEILGDADEPAPYFGTVRRLQVSCRKAQSEVLVQAIQNHSPDIVVVDEIGNTEECEGICSIIHRGTTVLCSVHGWSLAGVVRNLKLNVLFGGSQPLLLSYEEKRAKQKVRKTALERMNPIGFQFAVQLKKGEYGKALLYLRLDKVVDRIYDTENWVCGGADLAYEVDLAKPLLQQVKAADIMKAMGV